MAYLSPHTHTHTRIYLQLSGLLTCSVGAGRVPMEKGDSYHYIFTLWIQITLFR